MVQQGHFLQWRRDRVRLPDGKEAVREFVVHPGAVMIIPLLPDGRLLMERQFRYPVGMTMIEFPAGKLDSHEAPMACAQRELLEETGYTAARWARAGVMHPVIGYATEIIEIWFADGLTAGERQLDEGEFLDIFTATQDELETCFRHGQLTDVKTIVGLMWLRQWREGHWSPEWRVPTEAG
jgi:ADP-ribose pyrophosphatase